MKKLISVLLVAIMMLVGVVVVYANEAPAAVEYVLTGEIVKDEVHLSFDIANNDVGFAMLIFDMAYNPEAVSFVSVSTDECVLSEPDVDDMSEYGLWWSLATWSGAVMAVRFITSFCFTTAQPKSQRLLWVCSGRSRPSSGSPAAKAASISSIIRHPPGSHPRACCAGRSDPPGSHRRDRRGRW